MVSLEIAGLSLNFFSMFCYMDEDQWMYNKIMSEKVDMNEENEEEPGGNEENGEEPGVH